MRNLGYKLLDSVDDSVSQTSTHVDCNQIVSASWAVHFSDSNAAGTVKIQASNDPVLNGAQRSQFTPTHWVDIPNASVTVTAGGDKLITIANMTYGWIRVVWTSTTPGTGSLLVNMNALGI